MRYGLLNCNHISIFHKYCKFQSSVAPKPVGCHPHKCTSLDPAIFLLSSPTFIYSRLRFGDTTTQNASSEGHFEFDSVVLCRYTSPASQKSRNNRIPSKIFKSNVDTPSDFILSDGTAVKMHSESTRHVRLTAVFQWNVTRRSIYVRKFVGPPLGIPSLKHTTIWYGHRSGARYSHKQLPKVMTTTGTKQSYSYHPERHTGNFRLLIVLYCH